MIKKRYWIPVFTLALGVAIVAIWRMPPATAPESLRSLADGQVLGFDEHSNTHAWLGIPFAKPPLGDLRWRAPRPVEPWADTLDAVRQPSFCTQVIPLSFLEKPRQLGQEDCLYLNVYAPRMTPEEAASSQLPVMFWIHGGANNLGGAGIANGYRLAGEQNVIVVAVQYRLGIFGWLSHPALRATALIPDDESSNFGLLDQIAGLTWVQENIRAFGGDPTNVTIFGESAGGFNVLALMGSPKASGLFHKAIAQSGSLRTVERSRAENYSDDAEPGRPYSSRELINNLLVADQRAANRLEAKAAQQAMTEQAVADYLRGKSSQEMLNGVTLRGDLGYYSATNIRDGRVLPEGDLKHVFATPGAYNQVPVILGNNRDEYKFFFWSKPRFSEREWLVLPKLKDPADYNRVTGYFSDLWQAFGVDEPARALASSQPGQVYTYRFDWDEQPEQWGVQAPELFGAAHGIDMVFLFGRDAVMRLPLFAKPSNEASWQQLAQAMRSYWAEFARTGSPGTGGGQLPAWPALDDTEQRKMRLDSQLQLMDQRIYVDQIKQRLRLDDQVATVGERCELYAQLFYHGLAFEYWSDTEYQAWGCAEFPPESIAPIM